MSESCIYLQGDASPLYSELTVEELAHRVLDVESMAQGDPVAFVRIPTGYGDALVRPSAISAMLPCEAVHEED